MKNWHWRTGRATHKLTFSNPPTAVGGTTMTGKAGLTPGKRLYRKATTAAMALRAACSGIEIKDYTRTHPPTVFLLYRPSFYFSHQHRPDRLIVAIPPLSPYQHPSPSLPTIALTHCSAFRAKTGHRQDGGYPPRTKTPFPT